MGSQEDDRPTVMAHHRLSAVAEYGEASSVVPTVAKKGRWRHKRESTTKGLAMMVTTSLMHRLERGGKLGTQMVAVLSGQGRMLLL
jgi:hypothetical protein